MTVRDTIYEELAKVESRHEDRTAPTEEGLSPEVKSRMDEGRRHAEEMTEKLKLEQEGNEALGESMPGDVAGEAVEEELEENERESAEAGLSPEVQDKMAKGRDHQESIAAGLSVAQNQSAALGESMPGDVAGENLEGTTDEESRAAAERASESVGGRS
jgi:hypothetical protein